MGDADDTIVLGQNSKDIEKLMLHNFDCKQRARYPGNNFDN